MAEKIEQIINQIDDLASDFSFDEEVFVEIPEEISLRNKKHKITSDQKSLNDDDKRLIEEFIRTKGVTRCPDGFAKGSIDTRVDE